MTSRIGFIAFFIVCLTCIRSCHASTRQPIGEEKTFLHRLLRYIQQNGEKIGNDHLLKRVLHDQPQFNHHLNEMWGRIRNVRPAPGLWGDQVKEVEAYNAKRRDEANPLYWGDEQVNEALSVEGEALPKNELWGGYIQNTYGEKVFDGQRKAFPGLWSRRHEVESDMRGDTGIRPYDLNPIRIWRGSSYDKSKDQNSVMV